MRKLQPWRLAAILGIAALFLINVYRAATQSVTHDEGTMFEWMLAGPWSLLLTSHGNHHVLSDFLCKFTISLFGLSEISLRIPTLLGGLLYFYAVYRLSLLLFGETFQFLLSVAFLCLNPFVLDYLVCARGYGLSLGFFFYALYLLARHVQEPSPRLLNKSGAALGISIGCNVIMIFPGAALVASFLAMLLWDSFVRPPVTDSTAPPSKKERRRKSRTIAAADPRAARWRQALLHFVLPALAVAGIVSMLPDRLIEVEAGFTGPPTLAAILQTLVRFSMFHSPTGFAGMASSLREETATNIVAGIVVPAALVALLAVALRIAIRWLRVRCFDALPFADRFLLLITGTVKTAVILIVVSRYVFGQPYPEMRTAMYWIPVLSLASLCVLRRVPAPMAVVILLLCVVQYATQFNTRYFAEWTYCAAGKDMMQMARADHAATSEKTVRVGATWQLEPVINFYRAAWGLRWMAPVYRESPDNAFDYYLLAMSDTPLVDSLHLKTLLRDPLSGTVLAKPQ